MGIRQRVPEHPQDILQKNVNLFGAFDGEYFCGNILVVPKRGLFSGQKIDQRLDYRRRGKFQLNRQNWIGIIGQNDGWRQHTVRFII